MKLSHSSKNKYKECPARYDFHYNKRYRTSVISSSLFFGTAFDEAVSVMLLRKKKVLTDEEQNISSLSHVEIFDQYMNITILNEQIVSIPDYTLVNYTRSDMDVSLLTEVELDKFNSKFNTTHTLDKLKIEGSTLDEYYRATNTMLEIDLLQRNYIAWLCLYRKGLMLLEAYETLVIPQIHEVHSIQRTISLINDSGDEITGKIDFEASFIDDPDTVYIVDNKTASKAYKPQDLDESEQLNLYAYAEQRNNIAYIVVEKSIRKKEPRVRISILKGEVNTTFAENVIDEFETVLYNIEHEKFKPNFKSGCFFFGSRCEYYNICHNDTIPDTLVIQPKRDK